MECVGNVTEYKVMRKSENNIMLFPEKHIHFRSYTKNTVLKELLLMMVESRVSFCLFAYRL